jgi:hypothetical protein
VLEFHQTGRPRVRARDRVHLGAGDASREHLEVREGALVLGRRARAIGGGGLAVLGGHPSLLGGLGAMLGGAQALARCANDELGTVECPRAGAALVCVAVR